MAREVTVLLRNEPESPKSVGAKTWTFVNEFIKSPFFAFVFGASFVSFIGVVRDWLTPADQLARQRTEQQTREDAAFIAPFLSNLDANKEGQFDAVKAALLELGKISKTDKGDVRPIYAAVNQALITVATQIRRPPEGKLSEEDSKKLDTAPALMYQAAAQAPSVQLLSQDTIVYVQVAKGNKNDQCAARYLIEGLQRKLVMAPSIEEMGVAAMPKRTQIRYFHPEDEPKAEQLANWVSWQTGAPVSKTELKLRAKPGTLEAWLGTDMVNAQLSKVEKKCTS